MALRTFAAIPGPVPGFHKDKKKSLPAAAAWLVILLVATLLFLQGRGMYDVNRLFNPNYLTCISDVGSVGGCDQYYYHWHRVIAWSYVSLPLFLIYLVLSLLLRKKHNATWQRAFFGAFVFLTLAVAAIIFAYITNFLFQFHRMLSWYVLFGVAAALLVALLIYIDKKNRQPANEDDHLN